MERLRGGGATTNDPTAVAGRRFVAWILDSLFMAIVILVIHRSGVAFLDEAGNLTINPVRDLDRDPPHGPEPGRA